MDSPSNESERDTVKRIKNLGRKLLRYNASSSVDKLLELLDSLELVLSMVEQSPAEPIQESLVYSMKALISDELLRHTDEHVKVSVASCIAELARITAPDSPYDDEQMKEMFKLMVSAFGNLSDASGRRYEKALAMLDNAAKIRLCLVMLDLECDDLVIEMFQHFLRTIRSNHPPVAIDSMESIMTLVLDESEGVSSDLLRPLLESVRKENQTNSPISWTLAEKVIKNCSVKLRPYLTRAVESSGRALDEYAEIITSVCQNQNGSGSPQHGPSDGSNKTVVQAVEDEVDVPKDANEQPCDKELEPDNTCANGAELVDDTKSNISAEDSTMDDQIIKKSGSKRKLQSDLTKNSKSNNAEANPGTGSLESKPQAHLNTLPRKRGRKPNSLMNAEEGYDHSPRKKSGKPVLSRKNGNSSSASPPPEKPTFRNRKDKMQSKHKTASETQGSQPTEENTEEPAQSRENHDIGCNSSPCENPASSKDDALSKHSNMSDGHDALVSEPEANVNTEAPSANHRTPDKSRPKRGRPRKRDSGENQDVDPNSVSTSKEDNLNPRPEGASLESSGVRLQQESEVRKDSEVKPQASIRKIRFTLKGDKKTAAAPELMVAETEPEVPNEDEEKHNSLVNIEAENGEEGRSSAHKEVRKRRKINAIPNKDQVPNEDDEKHNSLVNIEAENGEEGSSSVHKEVRKRRKINATPNKDLNRSSAITELIVGSASETLSGAEETPQTRLRRRRTTGTLVASETRELGDSLVGSRIRVWWPMDKTYYEGIIDAYDPVKGKHKVLYADGEIEILNLKKQRWEIMVGDVKPEEEQGLALHKLAEATDIVEKSNDKCESEPANDTFINSKSRACSGISKSESASKSMDTSVLDRPGLVDESTDDLPWTVSEQESSGKTKTRRRKAGSEIKMKNLKADDLDKEKAQDA